MIVFTDGSDQSNPVLTGSGVAIIANAVKYMGSSYVGELEAIKTATEYARDSISPSNESLHIISDCQPAISSVTSQNRENYHNSTKRAIYENLMDKSPKVQNIRLVYCPPHQGIQENKLAGSLPKTASKKQNIYSPTAKFHHLKYNKVTTCSP